MKVSNRNIYLHEVLMLLFIILCQVFVIIPFKSFIYLSYIKMLIWLILFGIVIYINGFPKDNNYFKKLGIKYSIIYCLLYIIIMYFLGLFTGFSRSIYSHTIKSLFNNIFPVLIMIISREFIRYIYCRKSNDNNLSLFFLTFIFILYDILLALNYYTFNNTEQVFIFICIEVFASIARNFLFTYISNKVSLIPTLILSLVLEIFWYIVPIIPSLGNYITSVLGILMPYFLYLKMKKMIKYSDKQEIDKSKNNIFIIPVLLLIICIFILVSGIGKYRMIAIASNSMNPIYYRGDAVIYEKVDSSKINKGDILVFNSDGMIITHRVVDIVKIGSKSYFRTKGDNNSNIDMDLTTEENVLGRVKYIAKYIGYPTVILGEMFKK